MVQVKADNWKIVHVQTRSLSCSRSYIVRCLKPIFTSKCHLLP